MIFKNYHKNKNELLVLTGAVYAFVAYLTAFTLEILFIIDLAKRNSESLAMTSAAQQQSHGIQTPEQASSISSVLDQTRLALDSMHLTTSCLAISILYFVTFIASLILIVALILRSTVLILIWLCIMTTLFLPEFGLTIYVSVFGWGIETRNGQTELLFYLLRAALNVIFIYRSYRLLKEWNYEKNFFMMKGGRNYSNTTTITGGSYDSPYFIAGADSTTINPMFSSSTLHLNRYDHIREFEGSSYDWLNNNTNDNVGDVSTSTNNLQAGRSRVPSRSPREVGDRTNRPGGRYSQSYFNLNQGFYNPRNSSVASRNEPLNSHRAQVNKAFEGDSPVHFRPNSANSVIGSEDCELDIDYRTFASQRTRAGLMSTSPRDPMTSNRFNDYNQSITSNSQNIPRIYSNSRPEARAGLANSISTININAPSPAYSTQSLDRRNLKDTEFNMPEQVLLRPLGHQPFEYLYRPGSSSNLHQKNVSNK